MEVHLHFGMHRNVGVIREHAPFLNGLVIPAHILAHQHPSTSAFVSSLPADTGYLIDPVTYRLQSPLTQHLNATGEKLRISSEKLCAAYHPQLGQLLRENQHLTPDLMPSVDELTKGCLRFQVEAVEDGTSKSAARKYLERYDRSSNRRPRAIIPPYFRFSDPQDPWYSYSLDCARAALTNTDTALAPVLAAPLTAFDGPSLARLLNDYSDFDHVILWIDGYDETAVDARQVRTARSAVAQFSEAFDRVEVHFGGYLLLLSAHDGLASIGHGILYTQHRDYRISGAGEGGAPERYYIPRLRQFRSLSQTEYILQRFPELLCDCPICVKEMRGDPSRLRLFEDDPDLLRAHFLHARRAEADAVLTRSLPEEAALLRETYDRYHAPIAALPNPDARQRAAHMQGLGSLQQWADGISAKL